MTLEKTVVKKKQLRVGIVTRVTELIYDQGIVRKVLSLRSLVAYVLNFEGKSAGLTVRAKGNDDEERKEGMMETRTDLLVTVPVCDGDEKLDRKNGRDDQ